MISVFPPPGPAVFTPPRSLGRSVFGDGAERRARGPADAGPFCVLWDGATGHVIVRPGC